MFGFGNLSDTQVSTIICFVPCFLLPMCFKLAGKSDEEVEFGSMKYFLLCGLGGAISCGITHTSIVALDLVKCRIQVSYLNDIEKI